MFQPFSNTTKNGSANKFCKAYYNADNIKQKIT